MACPRKLRQYGSRPLSRQIAEQTAAQPESHRSYVRHAPLGSATTCVVFPLCSLPHFHSRLVVAPCDHPSAVRIFHARTRFPIHSGRHLALRAHPRRCQHQAPGTTAAPPEGADPRAVATNTPRRDQKIKFGPIDATRHHKDSTSNIQQDRAPPPTAFPCFLRWLQ